MMSEILIIVVLIVFNGLLSMSEMALISVRKSHLSSQANRGNRAARAALKVIKEPDKFLSTVQIGITIIGILTGLYSGDVLSDDFAVVLSRWGVPASYAHVLAQGIIVVVVTYFTLVFGELVPKRIGMSVAESTAKIVARPMHWLSVAASPFVWLLAKSTSFVFNLMGLRSDSSGVTEEEIKSMIEEGTRGGQVQLVEQDIVDRVFLLGDLKVSSLMTHRLEVVSLDVNMTNQQIREVLKQNLHEAYPVVDRSFDNVMGMVTLKDLIFEIEKPEFDLRKVLRAGGCFHENMSVYRALERMKEDRMNHALVFDEFGSCQGIITLNNILEGLVGAIDNTSTEADIIQRADNQGWLVDGQCSFHDFLSYFDKEHLYSSSNYNTVGGLVLEQLERIPESGEIVMWKDFRFEIVDMDGARIDKILVTLVG